MAHNARHGHNVVFATPAGRMARADSKMATGEGLGILSPLLKVDANGRSEGSFFPAPIVGWPDLVGKRGCRDLGVCGEVVRVGGLCGICGCRGLADYRELLLGRRGIRRRQGMGCRWEVIPGTEQSTRSLTRRFPLRVPK
jgi:hypothetical protein